MKLPILFTVVVCALLAQAAPKTEKGMGEKIAKMLDQETKENRMMALHELMKTKERKTEIAKVLKADAEFREVYGNATTGGG